MQESAGTGRRWLRPQVELHEDHVHVRLSKGLAVLGLHGDLMLPYSTIASVVARERAPMPSPFKVLRVGTHVPGGAAIGHFWEHGEHRFYAFLRNDPVLELHLTGDAPFRRVVVTHPDPEPTAAAIAEALRREANMHAHPEEAGEVQDAD